MKKSIILLFVLLFSICVKINSENSDFEINYEPEKFKGKEQIKYIIDHYFKLRYEGQKKLDRHDFSFMIADWIGETNEWANVEKEKREIELYLARLYQLNYVSYDYKLDFTDFRYMLKGKKVVVTLYEYHEVVFEAIAPQVSKLANREHIISLRKKGNTWKISYDQYESEFSQLLKDHSKEEIISKINKNRESELKAIVEWKTSKKCEMKVQGKNVKNYDRKKAVKYANMYWNEHNHKFDDFQGNDCTNYISQILLKGGAPMDNSGQYQWFFKNIRKQGTTYSYSWAVVQDLYYYLINNYWTGPFGKKSTLCEMQTGDIIQFYSPSKGWLHSIVVVKIPEPENCGISMHYLTNSHDSDRLNYPLAYFAAHRKRYIHIKGWYE